MYSTVGGEGRSSLLRPGEEGRGGGPWSATTVERPPPPLFFSLRTSYTDAGTAYGRTSEGKGPNEERCCCFRQRERERDPYVYNEGGVFGRRRGSAGGGSLGLLIREGLDYGPL